MSLINRSLPLLRSSATLLRPTAATLSTRPFATKKIPNKDSLNPQSNEYTKTGTDQSVADSTPGAFDSKTTEPETEKREAQSGGGDQKSALNVSPANHDVSKPQGGQKGGAQGSPAETEEGSKGREAKSGPGSPTKAGKV